MQTVEDRIRELARDVRPVRPIPPLGAVVAAGAILWLATVMIWLWLGGSHLRPWSHADWSNPAFLSILAGLAIVAVGATLGALASSVPGRESTVRVGLLLAVVGGIVSITSGILSTPQSALRFDLEELFACLSCISHSAGLGILSVLISCAFIAYAVLRRPSASASLAIIGGVALGATVVHATCEATGSAHQLVSHVLAPLIAAVVLTLPVSFATRILSRRIRRD